MKIKIGTKKKMLKVKEVRIVEKKSQSGNNYKILEVEFANGYVFVSNNNKGYIRPDTEFCINMNQQ